MRERHVKVSVLIPTYNYARYLPQAIESVLDQTFEDFELLISDDASKDESQEIIRSYADRDQRIRFQIQSPNLGMVNNWNWCMKEAKGKYIKFVFGDDYLLKRDSLAQLVEMIESRPDIALASSARTVVDENSARVCDWENIGSSGIFGGAEAISWSLRTNCNVFGEPSVVLFKKSQATRGFDTTYSQIVDWELWIHLLEQGNLAHTTEPLCAFRRHSLQQTEKNRQAMGAANEHPRLIKQYLQYLVFNAEYRRETFERLRRLRRLKEPAVHDLEMAQLFEHALGRSFFPCWMRHQLSRPVHNVRRFWIKHVRGMPVPPKTFPHPRRITPLRQN